MGILNGAIDRRLSALTAINLKRNPFLKTEPPDDIIDQVFVAREAEIRDAALRVFDAPRNLLVLGDYGGGKTTFVKKLLRELRGSVRVQFLTGYAPLRQETVEGFQLAALSALAEGAMHAAPPSSRLHDFALATRQELARLDADSDGLRLPDLRFGEGVRLCQEAGYHRVVIAIDEVDKRDAQTIQAMLMGARHFLDLPASFVLTGRYLDVFSDPRSSLLAAFDHRIELRLFQNDESQEIVRRNLAVARQRPEESPTLLPFEADTVEMMVVKARGLPRPLNLMAYEALEEVLDEAVAAKREPGSVTTEHLERALRREGNLIYNDVGARARDLLSRIFRRTGYVSGAELDALAPSGGLPEALRELEQLSRSDAVLHLPATDGSAFALSPQIERSLSALETRREQLRALWREALAEADATQMGRRLETFAAEFFGEAFVVETRNVRTDTEEIDLVLSAGPTTDPRFREATYLFAECKNSRTRKVDQTVVSKFLTILRMHRSRQGFILTTGTFTEDAAQQAKNAVLSDGLQVLLLPGPNIEAFLQELRPVGDFLADLHLRQILRVRS